MIQETTTTVEKAKSGKDGASVTAERKMVESIKEFCQSYSSSTLSGVTAIESGYNEKTEEAWVKVGLTRLSMKRAKQLGGEMNGRSDGSNGQGIKEQPGEVRTRVIR